MVYGLEGEGHHVNMQVMYALRTVVCTPPVPPASGLDPAGKRQEPIAFRLFLPCRYTNVPNTDSLFCNAATFTREGHIAVVGGHVAKSGYADGLRSLRIYNRCGSCCMFAGHEARIYGMTAHDSERRCMTVHDGARRCTTAHDGA